MKQYSVTLLFEYNLALPVNLNEDQLMDLVRFHSRPQILMPRNYGFYLENDTYIKINLRKLMAFQANLIGETDAEGDYVQKRS